MSVHKTLQRMVSQLVYPTKNGSWYENKGYQDFNHFFEAQQGEKSVFPDMQHLVARQSSVKARMVNGTHAKLDTVTLMPKDDMAKGPCKGKHVIYFFGRNEPYEVKFREIATDAAKLGATVHAFNLPGMYGSSGTMTEFNDAVNSGIAQVNNLIKQGINPDDIILKGNCFGASIASEVQHKCSVHGMQVRVFNSNSYRSLWDVVLEAVPKIIKAVLENFPLLDYTGWNTNIAEKHLVQNPYTCIVHRSGDRTIKKDAKLQTALEEHKKSLEKEGITAEELKVPGYEEDQKFLEEHNVMFVDPNLEEKEKKRDPHVLKFGKMKWKDDKGEIKDSYELFGEYVKHSNEYIAKNPQKDIKASVTIPTYSAKKALLMSKAEEKEMRDSITNAVEKAVNDKSLEIDEK